MEGKMESEAKDRKPNAALEVRTLIAEVAAKASNEDRESVAKITKMAREAEFSSRVFDLTPSVCAVLFISHNGHNRDWTAETAKEYARRMTAGLWRGNNATVGFYTDGNVEDGAHRLSGAALAGYTLRTTVVFGIERDAISTVDNGKARHGSDHAKLSGIENAVAKQRIIKGASSYYVKLGDKSAALRSESEVHAAIMANDERLEEAILIAEQASVGIADPVLRPKEAGTLVYLMLSNGWTAGHIRERLAEFQTGVSKEGEKTPLFVTAVLLKDARARQTIKDRLNSQKEVAATIYAMVQEETGAKAISGAAAIRNAIKKRWPNPAYPTQAAAEAAA
jgi:hypothetical protein